MPDSDSAKEEPIQLLATWPIRFCAGRPDELKKITRFLLPIYALIFVMEAVLENWASAGLVASLLVNTKLVSLDTDARRRGARSRVPASVFIVAAIGLGAAAYYLMGVTFIYAIVAFELGPTFCLTVNYALMRRELAHTTESSGQ